ncbi:type I restriction enzyme M protein [Parapedobacter luteus]|uniref:site-specific DNA-methyltransferase (adenine-specific) n=1 Tax=Parapedobacter luteus TaxID=623280 RepID=A0A1T5CK98_9SPHI|nr:N-6 DNA methylase [Parapedobacter luteus]SKB59766.1 type I restriction enzyme M protein [Parapedobacter luteus]
MDILGRYYTNHIFSKLLVDNLSISNPKNIVELGVGDGALFRAAFERWSSASFYVTDIDDSSIQRMRSEFPNVKSFQLDTIKENIIERLNISDSIDIAICNPPYLKVSPTPDILTIFEKAQLHECKGLRKITSDILFLAKNLEILGREGELGIILPDGLITGKEFISLRSSLLAAHNVKAVIQLPENIFKKTEALTHIVIIEKGSSTSSFVPVFLSNKLGEIVDQIDINQDTLVERMDYKYNKWKKANRFNKGQICLKNLKPIIKRGNKTHKELKELKIKYLHSTNLPNLSANLDLGDEEGKSLDGLVCAEAGDIIISRVGKIGKIAKIKSGKLPISDCLLKITLPDIQASALWKSLTSKEGQEWLKANSHGVCAKVISLSDLMNFPIKKVDFSE